MQFVRFMVVLIGITCSSIQVKVVKLVYIKPFWLRRGVRITGV